MFKIPSLLDEIPINCLFIALVPTPEVDSVVVGCESDQECPDYNACQNRKCMNPCAEDDPCAPSANCKVIGHQPVCTCPDGYIGDPRTECKLRKLLLLSYKNTKYYIISCLFNAIFKYGMCSFIAPRPECTIDPECPDHLACIREKCQNPCHTTTCGRNAECKAKNHRAVCVCLIGYVGDPYTICEERKNDLNTEFMYILSFYMP